MRAQEFVTESTKPTFNTARRPLNVPELIKRGAIFITHPHGDNGWETKQPTWDFSLITLQNVLEKSPPWSVEYKKYLRPESYREAIGNQQFWIGLGDEKYRQILWSIKKLGIPDEVAFLDGQLDEGWKEKLGAAALAGSMALGGSAQASPMGNAVSMAISSVVDKNRNASDEEFAKQIPDENDRETYLKAFKRVKRLRALAYSDSTVAGALKVREQQLKKLKKEIAEKYNIPMPVKEQGVAEGTSKVKYTKPNFDREWEEAERYPEFQKAGKDTWINIAKQGSVAKWSELRDVGNVDTDLSGLERDKIKRAGTMVGAGKVELPIVGRWPDGYLDLIAGNTRIATLLSQGHDPKVWVVDVPEEQGVAEEQLDEGLRDWIAALAATGAMALGTPAVAKQVPTTTAVSQQAYNQISQALATPAAQTLKKTAIKAGIVGTELAQFMAQCAHETANFTSLEEFGGSLDFRKYDPKYNPRKAKQLGNKVAGDGAKYKGRGFIQLTGRDNYKRAGQALGLPLEQRPELVERPDVAAKVAVWFWQNRVAPKVASFHDTPQATKPINPGMRGLQDRHTKFNAIKQGAMATPKDMAPRGRRI